jgi:anaerobic dimethyl sulfoxide reductase subunit A
MNPTDAEERGIKDGESVQVRNNIGVMDVTVRVTEDITPGVVSCTEGGWFNREGSPSVNLVTALDPTLPSLGTRTHTVFVEVDATGIQA